MTTTTYSGCAANLSQEFQLLIIHDPTQAKVCNHDVGIFSFRTEQEVFRFQVLKGGETENFKTGGRRTAMDDPSIMNVFDCLQDSPYEVGSVTKTNIELKD